MVSINGDTPTSMVFVREHPFKMDDSGGTPHFRKSPFIPGIPILVNVYITMENCH